jgi:hypothetical protein
MVEVFYNIPVVLSMTENGLMIKLAIKVKLFILAKINIREIF